MNQAFAPTAILFGALAGIVVAEQINVVLGVVTGLVVTVAAWFAIRAAENAVRRKMGSGTGKTDEADGVNANTRESKGKSQKK